jgi:hypothetical protein
MKRTAVILAATTALLIAGVAAARADDPGANRKASATYDADLRSSPGFRTERAHSECDSIESADLKAQCIATFTQAPTTLGPAAPPPLKADAEHPVETITNGPVHSPGD